MSWEEFEEGIPPPKKKINTWFFFNKGDIWQKKNNAFHPPPEKNEELVDMKFSVEGEIPLPSVLGNLQPNLQKKRSKQMAYSRVSNLET